MHVDVVKPVSRRTEPPDVVLGPGNVTDGREPDLLLRLDDGSVAVVVEADGERRYVCADGVDALFVGVADVTGDGHADLVGLTSVDEIVVLPHMGVFWPQDPLTTFGLPMVIGSCAAG
jgi:hypothetical protein